MFENIFEKNARRDPRKTALVYQDEKIEYGKLLDRGDRIGARLGREGVGAGSIVPIVLPRGIEAMTAIIGVLRAGGAFCFVDEAYPKQRIEGILSTTGAKTVIDRAWLSGSFRENETVSAVTATPKDPGLVVFTSGSTGTPKGVVISRGAMDKALNMTERFRTGEDVFLSTASFSFVAIVCDALAALYLGATLHIATDAVRKDALLLAAYVRAQRITTAFLPPQMLGQYLQIADGTLRVAVTGSEKVQGLFSNKTLIVNQYGASETCGPLFSFAIDKPYAATPIAGYLYESGYVLLDEANCPVSPGETGEICVWGQIADGYLNQPELTKAKFTENPAAVGEADKRIFHTGDLGRVNDLGQLEYVQRKDWMVKVRGYRVEPGEIESAILTHTAADGAVIKTFENMQGQNVLYGVYTAAVPLSPQEVRDAISSTLPNYMVPSFLEQIPAMPLGENGKVDRKQIAPPDRMALRAIYEPPRSDTEKMLCHGFEEALGVSDVGIDDDFALLGGDSISAVRVQLATGGRFSAGDILKAGTIRVLAALDSAVIPKAAPRETWPLTPPEEQMAIEQRLHPQSVSYNVNLGFRLTGRVDKERLQRALNQLAARHEALRSAYITQEEGFVRQVAPSVTLPLLDEVCAAQDIRSRVEELNVPFDISKAPLVRCRLFDTGDGFVLHLCFHHIIVDGASGAILHRELWQLYAGEALLPVETTLADYALWRDGHRDDPDGEQFFRELFEGGVPENEMPIRGNRPPLLPEADTVLTEVLPLGAVKTAAKRMGAGTYALLVSALGATLGKYCGSDDVMLGAAMSGRDMSQQDGIFGMFVNTVPIRVRPSSALRVDDYVRATAQTIKQVKAHQTYAFEKLAAAYAPERTPARSPIFDVAVNYLPDLGVLNLEDFTVEEFPLKGQAMAMDLSMEFLCSGDKIKVELSYSPLLFHDEVAQGFLEQFMSVINNMLTDETLPLRRAMALPEGQQKRLLEDFRGKIAPVADKTVLDAFMRQAKATPEAVAVLYREKSISYRELDKRTSDMAAYIHQRYGVGAGDTVGVIIPRSEWIPLCSLLVMKTGAAYVPLDPAYPAERLSFMLSDSHAKLLIAGEGLESRCEGYLGAVCTLHELAEAPDATWNIQPPRPEDLMVLLYTSGTTGTPKGVMLCHAGIVNFCTFFARRLQLEPGAVFGAYASFGFDAHMSDMYPALISGATQYILEEELRLDLTGLMNEYERRGVTAAFLTTQMGRQLVETMLDDPGHLQKLRALMVGGETLTPIMPPAHLKLFNGYGPTECSMASNVFLVDGLYERVPIGMPVDNTRVYILDHNGDLAPIGVAGELCIAGIQVTQGYLNRPDLTAEKFVEDPFAMEGDIPRMYKSGDVARYLPDGTVDFLGRRDHQVKIRGFRVELGEIERRIREYPGIKDATVQAVSAATGGKRIVAYVVMDAPLNVTALNDFIADKLPVYMVPSATMQIAEIPLTQNGKVNRRGLPEITLKAEELTPASTALEQKLLDLFHDVLGIEIGINTDVMYAGLSSLSAIRAAAKISALTGKHVVASQLMQEKTVERIARLCENAAQDEAASVSANVQSEYPLTSNQMGVYYACQKEPADISYNIPFCVALQPHTEATRLAACIKQVIDAHPYVKTTLTLQNGDPVQLRRDSLDWKVPVRHMEQTAFEQQKAAFVRPFTLLGDTLGRTEISVTPEGVYLLCDFHHIVFDGASADIFLRELSQAWAGASLVQEGDSAFELALREADRRGTEAYKEDEDYFKSLLGDEEGATILHGGKPRGEVVLANALVPRAAIDGTLRSTGVTRANLFLAAAALVVGRVARTEQARMATIINGRDGAGRENLFGMLVRTLPAVVDVDDSADAGTYCLNVQQRMFELMKHQGYPYTQIATDYHYDAQILFAYQGGVIDRHMLGDQVLTPMPLLPDMMKFPISIRIYEEDDAYRVEVGYDCGAFDYMQELAASIAAVAEKLAAQSRTAIGALDILSPKQRETLNAFNRPLRPEPPIALHQLFEAQARELPQATALIAADATFTFDELNRRANRLAHTLLEKGVEKGDRVAFMLPRTSDILVSMLGVLKAGACYIPVDPEYPTERTTYILEQSGAKHLLTTKDRVAQYANAFDLSKLSEDEENPCLDIRPEDFCYIIYTSGSTGKPKGVVLRHGGIVNYVLNVEENRHVRALVRGKCVMCSVTTVSFDMFLKEAFTTLMNGLTLVLADEKEANNPSLLALLMERTAATAFNATPSRMLQYMELPEMSAALSRMKVIMAGGERYPATLLERLRSLTDAALINTYGPTEITVSSNGKVLNDSEITIGAPLYNVVESVMDKTCHPLPPGVTGELYIGGSGVAVGYFNLPEMTKKQFVVVDDRRYYKSGDVARWTADGDIDLLGRNDDQIKLRGLRIELSEIENALTAVPGIKSGAVLVRALRGQEQLCAYYIAETPVSPQTLREQLGKTLTRYMVPTAYLQLEAFPMTPNGKLDRKKLPDAKLLQSEDYEAPANTVEKELCRIMGEILGVDKVSATGNFFEMGGHSLLVTRLVIEGTKLGCDISYGDVFTNPTPRALATLHQDKPQPEAGFDEYDYSEIDGLLKGNTLDTFLAGSERPLGNLLLTGATGFLGIHLLREYLRRESGTVYCLIRGANGEKRLMNMLHYYFSDTFESLFGSRIIVVGGNVTDAGAFAALAEAPIDTVINCAANVKHFSAGTDIEDINVGGIGNAIDFALTKGCRLVQISTVSVGGMADPDGTSALDETMLYFGQDLSNQYVASKFRAERLVLEACLKGLDGKVIRVGNLMARDSDGEFQINFNTNNFLGRLKAFASLGQMTYAQAAASTELAPIDCTADAILRLARVSGNCRVFHAYNKHELFFSDIAEQMNRLGLMVEFCEADAFEKAFEAAAADPHRGDTLRSLIAYRESGESKKLLPVPAVNDYTTQVLLRLGFSWPITSQAYIWQFLSMAQGLGAFDRG